MRLTNNIFDQGVFWLVILLAILPFGQILHVGMPGVTLNAFELIWLSLLGILSLKILSEQEMKKHFLVFGFICVAMVHIIGSAVVYDVSITAAVVQFRKYLPFMVALLLFATGTSISVERWIKGFVVAAGLSSFAALYIHHLAPGIIESSFSASEEVRVIVLQHGRLYWMNASLTFFVLLGWFCKEFKVEKWMLLVVMVLSFLAMFNTLNRTMLIGYSLFLIFAILISENPRMFLRRLSSVLVSAFGAVALVMVLSTIDERVSSLIELRFFGSGEVAEVYSKAVVVWRLGLYEQYMQSIVQHFPLGQGLGRPFASSFGIDIYTTDISFMSFLLPFGVMGLLIFGIFVYRIFSIIGQSGRQISKQTRRLLFLFVGIFLLMSLNIDFFSRNNFVIYLVVLIMSLRVDLLPKNWTGFTPPPRTHLKRPIMAVEERHAKKKKVLGGVQT